MTELTRRFLATYLTWVEAGARNNAPFHRSFGLCASVCDFTANGRVWLVRDELAEMFARDGLSPAYPFGTSERYSEDAEKQTQHLNEARINWIRKQLDTV